MGIKILWRRQGYDEDGAAGNKLPVCGGLGAIVGVIEVGVVHRHGVGQGMGTR
jgi:hypothetical protein